MKIYYASDAELSKRKANAIHVMKMCAAFAKQGNEVILIAPENAEGDKVYANYGVDHNFSIIEVLLKDSSNKIVRNVKRIFNGKKRAIAIGKMFNGGMVYARSIMTLFFLSNQIPFIYELHSIPANSIIDKMEQIVIRRKNLTGLVTISQALKDEYLKRYPYLDEKRIIVLHDGADEIQQKLPEAALYSDRRYEKQAAVGYIGSLYPGKCMEVLYPVAKAMPNVLFHVVGGDEDIIDKWKERFSKESVENIHLYGKVPPNEVNSYYSSFEICVMPFSDNIYIESKAQHDIGNWISPLKLFEAMAQGKAIVASNLPSIAEVMTNNKDCILVNPSDVNGWCEAISTLQNNAQLRKKLGDSAKYKFECEYSWNKRARKIVRFYLDHIQEERKYAEQ